MVHGRPNLRSRLHFRHSQEGGHESSYEHVVALEKKNDAWSHERHKMDVSTSQNSPFKCNEIFIVECQLRFQGFVRVSSVVVYIPTDG